MMRAVLDRYATVRSAVARGEDRGVAMVMVIGIMLVCSLVCVTLVGVTSFNTTFTVQTRAGLQAVASADAGIDLMLEKLDGTRYNELYGVCSKDFEINGDLVEVVTEYTVKSGGGGTTTKPCPAASDIVTQLKILSTATTTNNVTGRADISRTAVGIVLPTPPEVLLDKAIFGESSLVITNDSQLLASGAVDDAGNPIPDANVYSNGSVTCKTQVNAGGAIYAAHGDLILENNCDIANTVWAEGKVELDSNASVTGDVYAAGEGLAYSVNLKNSSSKVTGNVLTNGGINLGGARTSDNGGVGMSVFSHRGGLTMTNGATIGGSAYVYRDIAMGDSSKIGRQASSITGKMTSNNNNAVGGTARAAGTIDVKITTPPGSRYPNSSVSFPSVPDPVALFPPAVGFNGKIQPPVREPLPQVFFGAEELALWQAAGWVLETHTAKCTTAESIINSAAASWTSPRLLKFEGCGSTPVSFNNATLNIKGPIAIISETGVNSTNVLTVKSTTSTIHEMHWIVPAGSPGVTWNPAPGGQKTPVCSPSRDLFIDNLTVSNIEWMLYSPCKVTINNSISGTYKGQIYGGTVKMPNNAKIQMASVPIPSLATADPALDDLTDMKLRSRYDLAD